MNREELIKKWLDNDLNDSEIKAFEALEDHSELVKLSNAVQHFKAPEFNSDAVFNNVRTAIDVKQTQVVNSWFKPLLRVAAILVIAIGAFYYTTTLDTNIVTLASQKSTIELPDNSKVTLNATTRISFNKNQWSKNRTVDLDGEAYFIVAKGSQFDVHTSAGIVSVLGTQFKVKERNNLFEVICYEGSVRVSYQSEETILKPGDSFLLLDGEIIAREKEKALTPSWLNDESYFGSIPLGYVLNELERQYNVSIDASGINKSQLFTGSFVHSDLNMALKSITLAFNLNYSVDNDTVRIERE